MAVLSMLLGGVVGFFAAVTGWLFFDLGISSAFLLYLTLACALPCTVIAITALKPAQQDRKSLHPQAAR